MKTSHQIDIEPMVRNWFKMAHLHSGDRLPAERVLAETLGLSRAALRRGMAPLEADGLIVRQVGRGTFVRGGDRSAVVDAVVKPKGEQSRWPDTSPRQAVSARLAFEPKLGGLAALEATAAQLEALRLAEAAMNEVRTWPAFDAADEAFHRAIAACCGNPVLLHLFDQLTQVRRAMHWGGLRKRPAQAPSTMAVIEEHARIVAAIVERDAHAAENALGHHLMVEAATMLGGLP